MTAETTLARVLYVDDEENVLHAVRRQQRRNFDLTTVSDPREALERIRSGETYSVVVSDFDMPHMDGIALLLAVHELAPDTTRIMLTGKADLEAATRAVNDGHVFRFLTKPCAPEMLREALHAGVRIHELTVSERNLLERTLRGAIDVLTQTLSLSNPEAFGRASRVRRYVEVLAEQLDVEDSWQFSIAGMLSQLGCIAVPPDVARKAYRGDMLSPDEQAMLNEHPLVASRLLSAIPRMENVAEIVRRQADDFDPKDDGADPPPLGARLLRVALDFDALRTRGLAGPEAIEALGTRERGTYDPEVMAVAAPLARIDRVHVESLRPVRELRVGMIVVDPVLTREGLLIVAAGHEVTDSLLARLQNWSRSKAHTICEPIRVLVPETEGS